MLFGVDVAGGDRIVLAHRWQHAVVVVVRCRVLVGFLAVELKEAVKGHDGAVGAQHRRFGVGRIGEIDRHLIEFGRRHLRRRSPLPDQLVEPALVVVEIAGHLVRRAGDIGGADGFVRFLGVLGLGGVNARLGGHIVRAETAADMLADRVDRLAGHLHAVGSHIGDQADRIALDIHAFV